MRVKICGIKTSEDLKTAIDSGADAFGFLVGQVHKSTDFILPSTAARLAGSLPPFSTPVLVTHLNDVDEIINIVLKSSISTLQLHGRLTPEQVKKIDEELPAGGKIILAAYISKGNVPDLLEYYPFIDAVLLDAHNVSAELIEVEDHSEFFWDEAAAFVSACPLPVILSGGLSAENVSQAMSQVSPYAVDANRLLKNEPGGACCIYRCRTFVKSAKGL